MGNPIKVTAKRGSLLTGEDNLRWPEDLNQQLAMRMGELFNRMEIEIGDWQALAFALAFKHEPDFFIAVEETGRKRRTKTIKWGMFRQFFLWLDICDYKRAHRRETVGSICYKLWQEDGEWGKSKGFRDDDALRRRYADAKKSPLVASMKEVIRTLGREHFEQSIKGLRDQRDQLIADEDAVLNNR